MRTLCDRPNEMEQVEFLNLEEDENDLIVSFAITHQIIGVKSLILARTILYENFLDEEDRGVRVSMEGENLKEDARNMLQHFKIDNEKIKIVSTCSKYNLDISRIEETDLADMLELLKKQNYDDRFVIQVA
jgi:NH3-dependent NAD+ synthetase